MKVKNRVQPSHPLRPRSVTILAWLQFLQSLSLLGLGTYLLFFSNGAPVKTMGAFRFLPLAVFDSMISNVVVFVLALLGLVIAFALLQLRRWAWMAAVILQGFGLLAALLSYVAHRPNYVGMLTGVILVFYLNQQEVQSAFREKQNTIS